MNTAQILIVEQDASLGMNLEETLSALGYTVTTMATGPLPTSQTPQQPIVPTALDGIVVFDSKGTCHYLTPLTTSWLGGQPADFTGKTFSQIYPEPYATQLQNLLDQVFQKNLGQVSEIQLPINAQLLRVSLSIQPIPAANGQPGMASLKLMDINEQDLVRETLLKSEKRFRALIEKTVDMIIVIDAAGVIQFASPAVEMILGYAPQSVLGHNFLEWIHPEDLPRTIISLESRSRTPGTAPASLIARCRHKNGEWRALEALGSNLLADPAVLGIVLNIRDATPRLAQAAELAQRMQELTANNEVAQREIEERRQLELDLRQSEKRYRDLFEDSPISLWEEDFSLVKQRLTALSAEMKTLGITDQAAYMDAHPEIAAECARLVRVTAVNRATLNLFHATDRQSLLTDLSHLLNNERDLKLFSLELVNLLQGKTVFGWEGINTTFDGQEIEISLRWAAAPGCEESLSRVIISMLDITERKHTEEQLKKHGREISLLYNASLDLNQSLDQDTLHQVLHNQVSTLMNCDGLLISAYDQDTRLIRCQAIFHEHKPLDVSTFPAIPLEPEGHGTQSLVIRSAKPWLINDYQREIQNNNVRYYVSEDGLVIDPDQLPTDADVTRSAIILPLLLRGKVQGVIQIFSYRLNAYTREDFTLAQSLVAQFAIANSNALLYNAAQLEIDQRKAAEKALREAQSQLEERVRIRTAEVQDLYDNAPCGYHSVDAQGQVVHINKTELQWLGYERHEVIGHVITDFMSHSARARFITTFPTFKRSGILKDIELEFVRKDGSSLSLLVNATAIFNENGTLKMSRSTLIDISSRKRAEHALRESETRLRQNAVELGAANQALEKAARLKDEFLANMSHELRTPLTGILGLSEAMQLQTYGSLSEKQLNTLKNIEKSGRHLLELINDILDLSKIEAGKFDMRLENCSLGDICQAGLQLTRGMAQQKNQKIDFSMEPASITVLADKRRLKQMLVNLISNAVKFTAENGKMGLKVRLDPAGKQANLIIWDQGIGIQKADLPRLFEPFVQLDSSLSRQYAGTGLGLSLVKRMAELHNGSLSVESTPGLGSRFTISLPLASNLAGSNAAGTGTLHIRPRRALICDHNLIDAEQAARFLQSLQIASTLQPNPGLIVNQAVVEHPDFILVELNLPEKSGLDLLMELRADEHTRFIPVIISSVEEKRSKAISKGAAGYLVKPYTQTNLLAELEKIFRLTIQPSPHADPGTLQSAPLILIADDNEENLVMLADFLESRHFQTDKARNGLEMLALAAKNRPQIILVDIQMPEMNGLEAMAHIRADQDPLIAATPMIAITALAMSGDRERCLSAGANQYLSKPLELGMLVESILSLIKTM